MELSSTDCSVAIVTGFVIDKRREVAGSLRENKVRGTRVLRPPVWSMLLQTQRFLSTQEEEVLTEDHQESPTGGAPPDL